MDDLKQQLLDITQDLKGWLSDHRPPIYSRELASEKHLSLPKITPPKRIETPPPPLLKKKKALPPKPVVKKPLPTKPTKPAPAPVGPKKPSLELQPLSAAEAEDTFSDIAATFHRACPHIFIHRTVPDDRRAKLIKSAWKIKSNLIDVPIFTTKEMGKFLPFLQNLSKAIDACLAPSRVFEIETLEAKNLWDTLLDPEHIKHIVCPDVVLFSSPNLVSHYVQVPEKKSHKLGEIDLLVLPDISLYLKDPLLKRSLWAMLKDVL